MVGEHRGSPKAGDRREDGDAALGQKAMPLSGCIRNHEKLHAYYFMCSGGSHEPPPVDSANQDGERRLTAF